MTVDPGKDVSRLTYDLPDEWLTARERVYPVHVDPSLFTRSPDDTYVSSLFSIFSYGSSTSLSCGFTVGPNNNYTLVKFPQVESAIPKEVHVTSATFSIRQYSEAVPGGSFSIGRTVSSWTP